MSVTILILRDLGKAKLVYYSRLSHWLCIAVNAIYRQYILKQYWMCYQVSFFNFLWSVIKFNKDFFVQVSMECHKKSMEAG
jgi:hypothetical protein